MAVGECAIRLWIFLFDCLLFSFTVPVLWDKKNHTIVNNESSEIIRIFNHAFDEFIPKDKAEIDYYPTELRNEIDELNSWIYPNVNSEYSLPLTL